MTTAAEVSVPNPRFPGVEPRHARECAATGWNLDRCTCSPTYRGTAWSRKDGRLLKSPPFASPTAAKNWAQDAKVDLRRGVRRAPPPLTINQLADRWLEGLMAGRVRTRSGRAYKPSTVRGYEQAIKITSSRRSGTSGSATSTATTCRCWSSRCSATTGPRPSEIGDRVARDVARPCGRKAQPANPTRGLDLPAVIEAATASRLPRRRRSCSPCCRVGPVDLGHCDVRRAAPGSRWPSVAMMSTSRRES